MLHVHERKLRMSQKNLQARVRFSGYLQRKKGDSFSYQLYGLSNATKSGKYPWIYNAFRTRISRQTKNLDCIWIFRFEREIALLETGNHQGNREINPVNIALISHMRYFQHTNIKGSN